MANTQAGRQTGWSNAWLVSQLLLRLLRLWAELLKASGKYSGTPGMPDYLRRKLYRLSTGNLAKGDLCRHSDS